jgi:hypothetical protein
MSLLSVSDTTRVAVRLACSQAGYFHRRRILKTPSWASITLILIRTGHFLARFCPILNSAPPLFCHLIPFAHAPSCMLLGILHVLPALVRGNALQALVLVKNRPNIIVATSFFPQTLFFSLRFYVCGCTKTSLGAVIHCSPYWALYLIYIISTPSIPAIRKKPNQPLLHLLLLKHKSPRLPIFISLKPNQVHYQSLQPFTQLFIMFSCVNYERGCRGRTNQSATRCSDCITLNLSAGRASSTSSSSSGYSAMSGAFASLATIHSSTQPQ